jgi:hypothetical protein
MNHPLPGLFFSVAGLLALACAGQPPHAAAPAAAQPEETPAVASPAPPCYTTRELSPGQVWVDCTNGQSFVVRKGADGKWREEAKSRAGSRPDFASLEAAAKSRCGCS